MCIVLQIWSLDMSKYHADLSEPALNVITATQSSGWETSRILALVWDGFCSLHGSLYCHSYFLLVTRDSFKLVQVYSDKLVIAVHRCTLSKLVAWSDPYVSVVSLTTYANYLCWPQARLKQETVEMKERYLPNRHSYASGKVAKFREPMLPLAAVQLLRYSSVFLQKKRA